MENVRQTIQLLVTKMAQSNLKMITRPFWSTNATAQGKCAPGDIGALFKRGAARNSLLCKPTKAILTPRKLFECTPIQNFYIWCG